MNKKEYLAKIIAKDTQGLKLISACCSEAKVKIEDIKFLENNNIFLLSLERFNREKDRKDEKINSICKFDSPTHTHCTRIRILAIDYKTKKTRIGSF